MSSKTDIPGVYKERDGILINKDNDALQSYKMRKEQYKKMQKIESFENELNSLKNDMAEIKELLRGLVK